MNYKLLQALNGLAGHQRLLDGLMVFSATYLIYLVMAVVALVALPVLRRRDWPRLLAVAASLGLAFVLGVLASRLFFEPRPFTTHPDIRLLTPHAAGKSFPSDHATAAFAFAFALLAFLSRRWGLVALAAAVLIGFARVYSGIHYPGDIAGSALISGLAVLVVRTLWHRISLQTGVRESPGAGSSEGVAPAS